MEYVNVKINAKIGGDDVPSVEESEISQSIESVNGCDDFMSEFGESTCSGENVYDIFQNEDEMLTEE